MRRTAAQIESLEARLLLATFVWTNRATSNFDTFYGSSANLARAVVDRALADWGRVIVNFNRTSGNNTFNLNINAQTMSGPTRGSTSNIVADAQGKPISAQIRMDDNGGGAGWFFDPIPGTAAMPDDSDFDQLVNPFMATSSTENGADFYRTIAHEVCHAVGILIGGSLAINKFLTNTQIPDPNDAGARLYAFNVNGGAIEATLSTVGGGHLYEGPDVPGHPELPIHPGDLINSGRSVVPPPSVRQLISDTDAMILQLAYGYTILEPSQINTFHANLDTTSGLLTINGTPQADNILLLPSGGDLHVRVNDSDELIPLASISDIVIDPGDGLDGLGIHAAPPGVEIRLRASDGSDAIQISGDFDVLLEGPVHHVSALIISQDSVVRLAPGAQNVIVFSGDLPINGTGRLDLANGSMIIRGAALELVEFFLTSAYQGGAWTGAGIGTSMGDASQLALGYAQASDLFDTFPATFAGQPIDESDILIRHTRYGDANLDRMVNLKDFNLLAGNFGASDRRWSQGNFNYDQTTNLADFNLLAANFGASLPLARGGAAGLRSGHHVPQFADDELDGAVADFDLLR